MMIQNLAVTNSYIERDLFCLGAGIIFLVLGLLYLRSI
jgi:hypothetical protein